VSGRLSELVGPPGISTDVRYRILGAGRAARQSYDTLDARTKALLEAYTAGVNEGLASLSFKPPEYWILQTKPQPWRPFDALLVLAAIGLDLEDDYVREIRWAGAREKLGEELDTLMAALNTVPETPLSLLSEAEARGRGASVTPGESHGKGSNWFLVDAETSASGKPLLASDPHLGYSTPGAWYLARMRYGDHDSAGAYLPGAPFLAIGRSESIAYAHTWAHADVSDIVAYTQAPDIVAQREEVVRVKGGEDVTVTVRETVDGPILDPQWFNLNTAFPEAQSAAIRWVYDDAGDTSMAAALAMSTSRTCAAFEETIRDFKRPTFHSACVDTGGGTAYAMLGALPVRDESGAWVGFDQGPHASNPVRGFWASTNQPALPVRAQDGGIPILLGPQDRARRAESLLSAHDTIDLATLDTIQRDRTARPAQRVVEWIKRLEPQTDNGRFFQDLLSTWDGAFSLDSQAPTAYQAWKFGFLGVVWQYRFNGQPGYVRQAVDGDHLIAAMAKGELADWCDDPTTQAAETCDGLARLALDAIPGRLRGMTWRGGVKSRFSHLALSGVPFVRHVFSRSIDGAGGADALNASGIRYEPGHFYAVGGVTLRFQIDMAEPDKPRFIIAPGQSGHVLSRHYDDQLDAFRAGETPVLDMSWDVKSAPSGTRHLRLMPAAD
jgi:penicillin amidase